jgi:DNA primase
VEQSLRQAASGGLVDRIRSVDEILRVLQKAEHRIEKEECIRRVAERLGISEQRLIERYPELIVKGSRAVPRPVAATPDRRFRGNPEQRDLVHLLLHGRLSAAQVRALDARAFTLPACRRLIEIGLRHIGPDGRVVLRPLLDEAAADPACGALTTELSLSDPCHDDEDAHIQGCLDRLDRKAREQRLGELIASLRAAEREGRHEDARRLNAEVNELRLKKAAVLSAVPADPRAQNRHP